MAAGRPEGPPDGADERLRDLRASPFNPLPVLVWLVILTMVGIELALWLGGRGLVGGAEAVGWRLEALQRTGFSSALQAWMLENLRFPALHTARYLSYSFVHTGPLHAFLVVVLIAALGKAYGEAQGGLRLLLLTFLPPALGAAVFGLLLGEHELGWLFGGMAMVFGLAGGLTWQRWRTADLRPAQLRLGAVIGALLLARLAVGLVIEPGHGWLAEFAAFVIGFALAAGTAPGRWQTLRARLLQRR
jgi:rhomboid protease GluP